MLLFARCEPFEKGVVSNMETYMRWMKTQALDGVGETASGAAPGGIVDPELPEMMRRQCERIEAPAEDLRDFFGEESDMLVTFTLEVNVSDFLMAQRALTGLLEGWRVVGERRYDRMYPALVERCAVEVAPKTFDFAIRQGRQFWHGPGNEKLAIDLDIDEDRKNPWSEMTFLVPRSRHEWLRNLLPQIRDYIDAHHFMRGQAITAAGKFVEFDAPVSWNDVFLPPSVREAIERNCIELLKFAPLYKANGIPLKRGIILHGKPGTGKTLIGRALAQHCGVTFILATPGMLEDSNDVRRVFTWARRFSPSIVFFEDFDLVASGRHSGGSSREMLGEFLACLDGLDASNGIITIATTNDIEAIEPALKNRPSRFDCILEIPSMGRDERRGFIDSWKTRHGGEIDAERWADKTQGYTGAQLQELCRLAVFEAVAERIDEKRPDAERLPLDDRHFQKALGNIKIKDKKSIGFQVNGKRTN